MNYIQDLATRIKAATPTEVLPEADNLDLLFYMYALLLLSKGDNVTAEDVHNAWATWMSDTSPDHRSIIPFQSLEDDVKLQDEPFVAAIKEAYSALD